MKRIYPDYAYGTAPRAGCWWDETCDIPDRAALRTDKKCDVAIVGGGFTGISAALHLAEAGVDVTVLENHDVGFGASGRNGGFCCLGGGRFSNAALEKKVGYDGRVEWRQAEVASVQLVEDLIARFDLEVDRHSDGETQMAHRPKDYAAMQDEVAECAETYGVEARLTPPADLEGAGMNAGFHGALTIPLGFGLNPRKYITGLAAAAETAGAQIFHNTAVTEISQTLNGICLHTAQGSVTAKRVIIATNGYASEDVPQWLAGRYMPTQSSVIVTRPLTQSELGAQGWTTSQMAYDTRNLLHYFRLMPDNRMLFGVRGGLLASKSADQRAIARARADFEQMFPAWKDVETPHSWSGMVCLARDQMPFAGEIPGQPGLFTSMCYHGNGVAMASYLGALLADLVQDKVPGRVYPQIIQRPLSKFELGRFRRAVMPLAYAWYALADR